MRREVATCVILHLGYSFCLLGLPSVGVRQHLFVHRLRAAPYLFRIGESCLNSNFVRKVLSKCRYGFAVQDPEFSALFQATQKRILQYVNRRISWDVEDVVDDIFAVAWKRRQDIPEIPEEQIVWLYAIGRKVIANKIRYKARADRFNKLNNPLVETSKDAGGESNMVTNQVLMEMPKELREPLLLVEWDQLSVKDAAKVLGISESTVNNRLHNARELFARKYSSHE